MRVLAAALAGLISASLSMHAQDITGSIVGQVNDTSGASVPGTLIKVRNIGTGVTAQAIVDQSGSYTVPNLFAGEYELTAAKDGFATIDVPRLQLLAAQTVRQDITLHVGQVRQTVEVNSQAALIHTDSQTIGSTLVARQVSDLPLAARSIDNLISLSAGLETSGSNPRISGSNYWGGNNFTLNGISVNDIGNGGSAYTYTSGVVSAVGEANMPDPDALQEFKVDSGDMNAEYRNSATVTMVTKQGTNAYHGEAYEFLQNKDLDANQFLLNATGRPRSESTLNQFGGNVGGYFIKNRLFFFGSYRSIRQVSATTASLNLPSTAERNGDFSALCTTFSGGICVKGTQLYNPQTGQPFLYNQIPSAMITSQAKTMLSYVPAPTNPNSLGLPNESPNYIAPVLSRIGINGVDYRMDGQISSKDSVYGVFHWSRGDPWFIGTGSYPPNYGNDQNFGYTDYGVSATETHIFSPSAINEIRWAWVVHASTRTGQNTTFDPRTLFPQLSISNEGGLPQTQVSGYTGMPYDWGLGYPFPEYDIEIVDNFTKVAGRHTFKFGADETGYKNFVRQGGPSLSASLGGSLGTFAFTGQWTGNKGWPGQPQSQGNAFADFLLGYLSSDNYAGTLTNEQETSRDWEFYAQDTFQATSKLTLNYGLRYMYQAPWRVRDNRVSYLDLAHGRLALPEDSDTVTAPPLAIASLLSAYPFETTKQAGWPTSYYSPDTNNFAPRFGFAYRPFSSNKTVIRGGWGIYYDFIPGFIGAWENTFNPPWRTGSSFSSQLPGNPKAPFLPDLTFQNPFPASNQSGPPANPLVYMTQRNLVNPIVQQWNFTVEQQLGQTWMVRATYLGMQTHHDLYYAANINIPNIQQPNVPLQAQRPYQPWGQINQTYTAGKANLNQLQLEAIKRISHGLLLQAEYSYNRSMDNVPLVGGTQNPNNLDADYGNSDSVPRQMFVMNYIYDLPFGHGRTFDIHNKLLNGVAGGWTVSGITTYRMGTPFSVTFSVPSSIIGWQGGRADAVSGANIYAGQQSNSHDVVGGVQWFNTSGFVAPTPWQWGNSERNDVYGPGFWNWDISLQKYFPITESHRLQLRSDFLDAFNHFNLGNPSATIADTRDGGLPVATAGKIYSGTGYRIVQLALKYTF